MGWARIDDTHADHPKVIAAGPMAELLDVRAICWSNRFETDGRVTRAALVQLSRGIRAPERAVNRLVEVERWRVVSQRDGFDGWEIVGFLDAQISRAEREAERASARERQRRRRARGHAVTDNGSRPESRRESRRESRDNGTYGTDKTPSPQSSRDYTRDTELSEEDRQLGRVNAASLADALRSGTLREDVEPERARLDNEEDDPW
jgi:hypothetical protein